MSHPIADHIEARARFIRVAADHGTQLRADTSGKVSLRLPQSHPLVEGF
jgi:hypothetical protein